MAGINRFEGKDKRRERMRNHIAKDLRSGPKYGQRIIPGKKRYEDAEEERNFLFDAIENGYGE